MKILVFGATGSTGKHVIKHALAKSDQVYIYARSPDKLSFDVLEQVEVIQGNIDDSGAVSNAVKQVCPEAIIITSGIPKGKRYTPLNASAVPAIVNALQEIDLAGTCRLVILSGLFMAPRGEALGIVMKTAKFLAANFLSMDAAIQDNDRVGEYLFHETTGASFTIIRMGLVVESESKGSLIPDDKSFAYKITFDDMALFMVRLAHGEYKEETEGKAIKVNYETK